jgi:hypothetical protein
MCLGSERKFEAFESGARITGISIQLHIHRLGISFGWKHFLRPPVASARGMATHGDKFRVERLLMHSCLD